MSCSRHVGRPADARLAQAVRAEYADGLEGLTRDECISLGIDAGRCRVLLNALQTGAGGIVTQAERESLRVAGFSDVFVGELAGNDGARALRSRVRWLADNINTRWWRWDFSLRQRTAMIAELANIGPAAQAAIPALIGVLRDEAKDGEDPFVSSDIAYTLVRIGPAAIPALTEVLTDEDIRVRAVATGVLGYLGPAAIPALIVALRDGDPIVRSATAYALGRIGPAAQTAVPALTEALRDIASNVRYMAASALDRIKRSAAYTP